MGSSTNEKQARSDVGRPKQKAKTASSGIYSFRPSEAQKVELRMGVLPIDEAVLVLGQKVEENVGFSVVYNGTGHAISVIARDKRREWSDGVSVAVNHVDLSMAIRVMAYYLVHVNPEYPDQIPHAFAGDFDW